MWRLLIALLWLPLCPLPKARGAVGIVVYESKGVDSRRTNSGHISLIATSLCAVGIDEVRPCRAGEESGVVVTRYLNLASGYDRSVFVAPIRPHFYATSEPDSIAALTNDETLQALQAAYWRQQLRPYLPPLSPKRYDELRRFHPVRAVRGIVSLESVLGGLEAKKAVALVDPITRELIPNGNWREAIGAAHVRGSIMITVPATPDQESRLIPFIASVKRQPFQALTDNCSDFVERALLTVFSDSGLQFRPRIERVADAWVTNPLAVATDFLAYARRQGVPITVVPVPLIAGTRRPTERIHSMTRGALVPNPSQGKVIFGAKLALNIANPLLGAAAYSADRLSRFADLEQLVHERGGGRLSQIADEMRMKPHPSVADRDVWHREQIRVFGSTSCWEAKEATLRAIATTALEAQLLTPPEHALLLKQDRPFLLPQYYAASTTAETPNVSASPVVFGAGRREIRKLADQPDSGSRQKAFRLMLAVVNYDLSSPPTHRRTALEFDPDWKLFLSIAQKNGMHLSVADVSQDGIADCSCRELDDGRAGHDALADSLGFRPALAREGRVIVFGRNR